MGVILLAVLASLVVVPLVLEYADLRREPGLGRAAALGTTLLVIPALAIGLVVAAPLGASPEASWAVALAVALGVYSLAASAVRNAAEPARAPRGHA